MKNILAVVLASLLALSSVAWGGPVEEGIAAYERKDFATALVWFRRAADQGDASAQHILGVMYKNGEVAPKDDRQAVYWFRKAADQGHASAQFNLGVTYEYGEGVPQHYQQALYWYRKAADQGEARAQFNLGVMYTNGQGVPKDDRQALYWYRKAADQGQASAQLSLGVMYATGQGVPKDDRQALYWYRKAADQGYAKAQLSLGVMYAIGQGVPKDDQQAYFWLNLAAAQGEDVSAKARDLVEMRLTTAQRAAAQADARKWIPKSPLASDTPPNNPIPDSRRPSSIPASTGSGFRVATGWIVTNHHVVEGCNSLAVNGNKAARVQADDSRNDLALIAVTGDAGPSAEISSERPKLGESVTVAGFPLHGLLSGLTVTSGTISSLSGLRNDNRHLQISAAVQPGNSGGPLLSSAGAVAGVVVSKLDAVKVAELTGDIPQNVNFAVKASILRSLLDSSGVNYSDGVRGTALPNTEIAKRAQGFTVLVECWQ